METLLTTLLASLIGEMGDRTQLLLAVLLLRHADRRGAVLAGYALASLANCALSAFFGTLVADLIEGRALIMFQAIALLFAAAAMLWRRRRLDTLDRWTLPAFWTATIGIFVLEFGDKSQFVVLAAAARADWPWLAAAGGTAGLVAAAMPALFAANRIAGARALVWIRRGGGAVLGLVGAILAYRAIVG